MKRIMIIIVWGVVIVCVGLFVNEINKSIDKTYSRITNLQHKLNICEDQNRKLKLLKPIKIKTNFKNPQKYIEWISLNSSRCPRNMAKIIATELLKYNHYMILFALIQRESGFNPFELSSANARGLGQIRPFYVKNKKKIDVWENELKKQNIIEYSKDLYDPIINIKATNYIFSKMLESCDGDLKKALFKYVGGKRNDYVNDILKNIGSLSLYVND